MGKNSVAPPEQFGSDDDENKERGNWTGKMDFLLSTIGFAVGLGNVWRFPYKAAHYGGGSFLIPYLITLIFAGLPLFFMEMAFGQFSSRGPITVWNAAPFFKGVGYAMVIVSALVCIYYNMIIAYTLYYLFASFTTDLPWAECKEEWVEKYNCYSRANATNESVVTGRTASDIYFHHEVLDISESLDSGSSEFKWELVLCLLGAWIVVFLCLSQGIKSSGKVVYFTAIFPYVVLLILLVRNVTLPGAIEGIKFYVIPEWEKLKDIDVWYAASSQIFYSLGVAFGGLETMASYNRFHNNIHRDAVIVAVLNCCTSVFAGFVIFSVVGYMSEKTGVDVADMAKQGPGLAFIAYPEGIATMSVPTLWAILFFMMLLTLGLDSQFAMMETVISSLVDEFSIFRTKKRRFALTLGLCVAFFLVGLPQCARNGMYIVTLFEWYSAGYGLMAISLVEVLAITWVYGWRRFSDDIAMMIGYKPNWYWLVNWWCFTPILLAFILIYSLVERSHITYKGEPEDEEFPMWADDVGWAMGALALVFIPIIALVEFCKAAGFVKTMRGAFNPTALWGPAVPENRTGIYAEPYHKNGKLNPAYDSEN